MTTQSVWDDPDLRQGGEFVKFETVGDTISGVVTAVRAHRFDDGSVAPQILITTDDGEERTITAGQVRLKAQLAEQRPEAGDRVAITYTQQEKRAGGKTLKHFDVTVSRGGGATPPAPAAAPPVAAPPVIDAAAAAAAVAALTPEQRAQLGLA